MTNLYIYIYKMKFSLYNYILFYEYVHIFHCLSVRPVKYTDRDAFASSHYHIPEMVVEKENIYSQVWILFVANSLSLY